MADAPHIHDPRDIRGLSAKFGDPRNPAKGAHFSTIRGSDGYITAAGNAKVGIMSRWVIRHSGQKPDGKPMFRFKAQFSWTSEAFMEAIGHGTLKGRVRIQMKTRQKGVEDVDILGWQEWKYTDGVLILEDIFQQTEGSKPKA